MFFPFGFLYKINKKISLPQLLKKTLPTSVNNVNMAFQDFNKHNLLLMGETNKISLNKNAN